MYPAWQQIWQKIFEVCPFFSLKTFLRKYPLYAKFTCLWILKNMNAVPEFVQHNLIFKTFLPNFHICIGRKLFTANLASHITIFRSLDKVAMGLPPLATFRFFRYGHTVRHRWAYVFAIRLSLYIENPADDSNVPKVAIRLPRFAV